MAREKTPDNARTAPFESPKRSIHQPSRTAAARADGIVALTGGGQRLAAAGRLLQAQQARRLLISGVNRVVSRAELRRLLDIDNELFACCVDVGYAAQNTRGNAVETRKWALRHRFESLIVVTASYHMPRSLLELGRAMPDVVLHPHPVLPQQFREAPWWLQAASTKLLISEYIKLLPTVLRYATRTAARPFAVAPGQDPPAGSPGDPVAAPTSTSQSHSAVRR